MTDTPKHSWYGPGNPAGHARYCHHPGIHSIATECTDPTGTGQPSPAYLADHPDS